MEDECGGPPFTHVHDPEWPPLEWRYGPEGWPVEVLAFGTPVREFIPFTVGLSTPGELWREAVAQASAVLAGAGFLCEVGPFGGDWGGFGCFRCALPPAPAGDVFGLGAARIRGVRCCVPPAWQAGKLLAVFAV